MRERCACLAKLVKNRLTLTEDRTVVDGRRVYTHERLRRARSSLSSLVSAGTLFTYLDPALAKAGPLP